MESVVDKAFRDIQLADARLLFQRANIEDTFVRYAAIAAGIENGVSRLKRVAM